MNIGIIGCGTHAAHHAQNCSPFTVHTVWDPNREAMDQIPSKKKSATLEALLAEENMPAVMICSPDQFHLRQITAALNAGKHVFCEKPLLVPTENISQLEGAFDLAASKKLVISTGHPRRYDKPFRWFKDGYMELLRKFGNPVSFSFDFSYHRPSTEWKHSRSLLLDHLNHEVDLMNFLFGIQGFTAWKLNDAFDHYCVVGKRDDGITFTFQGTRRLKSHTFPEWCRIRFERGEICVDMMMGTAQIIDHDQVRTVYIPKMTVDYDGRLKGVMSDFYNQITAGVPGYNSRSEMLMNTMAGIVMQEDGPQRIDIRP